MTDGHKLTDTLMNRHRLTDIDEHIPTDSDEFKKQDAGWTFQLTGGHVWEAVY